MPKWIIEEQIQIQIEAESAEAAVEAWIEKGEDAPGYAFVGVIERDSYAK